MAAAMVPRFPQFENLPDADWQKLAALLQRKTVAAHTVLFQAGEPGVAAYFAGEGRIKIFRTLPDGRQQIAGIFTSGAPFGLIAILEHSPYPASAESLDATDVWFITHDDLHALLAEVPHLATSLMLALADRLRYSQDRLHDMAGHDVHSRLAQLLLQAAAEKGRASPGGIKIDLGLNHQELGALIGASRETVSRALADFKRAQAVVTGRQGRYLIRVDKLQAYR